MPHYLFKFVFTLRDQKRRSAEEVAKYTNFFEQRVSFRGRIFIDIYCGVSIKIYYHIKGPPPIQAYGTYSSAIPRLAG